MADDFYGGLTKEEFEVFASNSRLDPAKTLEVLKSKDELCETCLSKFSEDHLLCIGVRHYLDADSSRFYKKLILITTSCKKRRKQLSLLLAKNELRRYEGLWGGVSAGIKEKVASGAPGVSLLISDDRFVIEVGGNSPFTIEGKDIIFSINFPAEHVESLFARVLIHGGSPVLIDTGAKLIRLVSSLRSDMEADNMLDFQVHSVIFVRLNFHVIRDDHEVLSSLRFLVEHFRLLSKKLFITVFGENLKKERIQEVLGNDLLSKMSSRVITEKENLNA